MTPERWEEVKHLFADVLEQKPAERATYLNKVCTDASLRHEVELMITAHEQGGSDFMERPIEDSGALKTGMKLGPYEILARLGAGGMGEVYRARDAKLGRDVAIKVLPEAFARDADRMARFQREAKVLASLNHPNIATIHGLEDTGGTRALVMELVEGPTLADRIKAGPIPVDEAVRIARQIADALEYAHERGIIHRDLKPANVKVTNDDAVKVLDFGLAKALEGDASSIDISTSPAISRMATQQGVLLGTAAYMSPEQAKGKSVDRRADIWAFGCVLYEMLTGNKAFRGETTTDTLATVLKNDPDWSQLPAATPLRVRVLLQRCLQKALRQRLQAMGDARIPLEEVLSGAPEAASSAGVSPASLWQRRALPWAFALLAAAISGAAVWILKPVPAPPPRPVRRFEIPLPEKLLPGGGEFAVSPDGRLLAFIPASQVDLQSRIWLRSLETPEVRPLGGTEGAIAWPIWSPDSRYIAFVSHRKLKKIEVSGGPPVTICDAPTYLGGGWNHDDQIVFGSYAGTLQVSATGGSPTPITTDAPTGAPSFLPDGHHFVYWRAADPGGGGIYLGQIGTKPKDQTSRKLLSDDSIPVFAQSLDPTVGYLLFVRGGTVNAGSGTLMAQAFDNRRLELIGDAVPIAEQVSSLGFSASTTDTLVYMETSQNAVAPGGVGTIQGQLTWFDRDGKVLGSFGEPGLYRSVALSPDGKRVAFERADPQKTNLRNIWLYEFGRGITTRFTFDSAWDAHPVWSPDASRIAFGSNRGGTFDLYEKTSNLAGEDELLEKFEAGDIFPTSWSPDGRFLLCTNVSPYRMWLLPLGSGSERKFVPLDHSEFDEFFGRFSPDGRWIAYQSNESGRLEIYVRPFSEPLAMGASASNGALVSGKWMVSKDGGTNPLWRRDGKELFYLSSLGGTAMKVDVNTSGVFQASVPKALFKVPPGVSFWDVSPDGKRFLMANPPAEGPSMQPKFTVVLNWTSLLRK
jgi:eukaryotic-like serine/threonine-protein kinase